MREAVMKCKVAAWLLSSNLRDNKDQTTSLLHPSPLAGGLTRSRKLAADSAFCCQ
jgi:hypothetical protein